MNTSLKQGACVVIGDEYAKVLGYEEHVGAMGIIDTVMNALCTVQILANPVLKDLSSLFHIDIHQADCLVEPAEEKPALRVLVSAHDKALYYTRDVEIIAYLEESPLPMNFLEESFAEISDALDFVDKKTQEELKEWRPMPFFSPHKPQPIDYTTISIEMDNHPGAVSIREAFENFKKDQQESKSRKSSLLDSFAAQLDEYQPFRQYESLEDYLKGRYKK